MEQFLEREDDKRRQYSLHLRPSTMVLVDEIVEYMQGQGLKASKSAVIEAMVKETHQEISREAQ